MHPLPVRRPVVTAIAVLSLALLLPATSQARRPMPEPHPLVAMTLIDRDTGTSLVTASQRGTHWVAGEPGRPYAIRLTNTTDARLLVVLSVDGINAVSGDTADPSQAGYVLAPRQTTEIAGWRKSYDDIAAFVFTALPDSYAARTGRPDNVGAIGIAVFHERAVPRPVAPAPIARGRADAARAPAAASETASASPQSGDARMESAMPAQRIGTGHGAREWAPVTQTAFVRATRHPAQVSTLRYDAPDVLARMGLQPWARDRTSVAVPRAFPGGFVADPPSRY